MASYYLSEAAADDLDNIWIYGVNQWGLQQADRYHQKIMELLVFLAEHPDIGMNRNELGDLYQSYPISSHIVFFRAYKEKIKILRVLHQRMDAVLQFEN